MEGTGLDDRRPKVLVVSPAFFGYEWAIVDAFREAGADATFLDDRPSNHWLARALLRVAPRLSRPFTTRHFVRALRRARGLDLVLIIKGESVPERFLHGLRLANPAAVIVYYSYDPGASSGNAGRLVSLSDAAFSFDRQDVASDSRLRYKPLFYTPEFFSGRPLVERDTFLAHVGTVNPGRYSFVKAVMEVVPSAIVHLYVPARAYLRIRRLLDRRFRTVSPADVSDVRLSRSEVAEVLRASRVVLDVPKVGQSGLTMRTFEALACGAALVTTNQSITQEAFYDAGRIAVVSPEDPPDVVAAEVERLASGDLDGTPPARFDQHSVRAWVEDFLRLLNEPKRRVEN